MARKHRRPRIGPLGLALLLAAALAVPRAVAAWSESANATAETAPRSPFDAVLQWTAMVIEGAGVAIIALGAAVSTVLFLYRLAQDRPGGPPSPYERYRAELGRGILLGLEFLVAADIIGTVAIEPTFTSLGVLAGIVLIRTFLSFSLEVEINGRWPWQEAAHQPSRPPPEPPSA
jgi:uncharacterized membrane protein